MSTTQSGDALKMAANVYKLIMENDRVRVLDASFGPGAKAAMHSRPDHLVYVVAGGALRITTPNGKSANFDVKAGQAIWMEAGQHAAENVGKTGVHNLVVELKR